MKRFSFLLIAAAASMAFTGHADGRGWGGGGGGFDRGGGGFDRGSYSGSFDRSAGGGYGNSFSSFSGSDRFGGSYSGERSTSSYSNASGRGASGSYDHTWDSAAGGSISTSGSRSASEGAWGGKRASSSRDTTMTTAAGKTYSSSNDHAAAQGPLGRTVGGSSGSVSGPGGSASWNSAFAGNRYTGGVARYSSLSASTAHGTAYWSGGYMTTHAGACRTNFGYYGCFHPAWYTEHPGCWAAAGWAAGAAWTAATYNSMASYCGMPQDGGADYDYGSTVVVTNTAVTIDGQDAGTPQQFAQEATTIADKGQTAPAPPTDDWKPIGVYALVQGEETTSNNIFQLAVNKAGVIRGNYYDGLMDTTTDVYGSIDTKSQRAAWTIGKKKDRVFEAGVYNLTQPQCPCLIHIGTDKTAQMMLVRVEPPKTGN